MSTEREQAFRVVDRRPFNPDGTLRPEFADQYESSTTVEQRPSETPSPSESATRAAPAEPPATSPLFLDFLMGLVSSAAMHLGMVENPEAGQKQIDLVAAKQMIDLLGVLREKTNGNLSREEQQVFDGSLTELRMRYVHLTSSRKERA
ncbi:MAG TPA: DUF1844 domain-containing protein [Blastocatellia bacterium]|nr:DUF1844 domain-containing protein [Blastocatellia bacterium]